ncbi:MAG: nucleotide pyrophosphohydrolase [Bdellovibrionales bacterium]|nr:nucleotide pyrophosphohydrolase [Bdellovibrionales bacterium]
MSHESRDDRQSIEMIKQFCSERDWDQFHGPKELAIGLVTESSELLELFRFQSEAQIEGLLSQSESRTKVADELADIYFFLLRFADLNGFDLAASLESKMQKNREKYPVEKSKGKNQKYTEL